VVIDAPRRFCVTVSFSLDHLLEDERRAHLQGTKSEGLFGETHGGDYSRRAAGTLLVHFSMPFGRLAGLHSFRGRERSGKTYEMKIYPPFGKSPQEGHSFAYRGSSVWTADVFRFLDQHCGRS
jgi:hypothetical protein